MSCRPQKQDNWQRRTRCHLKIAGGNHDSSLGSSCKRFSHAAAATSYGTASLKDRKYVARTVSHVFASRLRVAVQQSASHWPKKGSRRGSSLKESRIVNDIQRRLGCVAASLVHSHEDTAKPLPIMVGWCNQTRSQAVSLSLWCPLTGDAGCAWVLSLLDLCNLHQHLPASFLGQSHKCAPSHNAHLSMKRGDGYVQTGKPFT